MDDNLNEPIDLQKTKLNPKKRIINSTAESNSQYITILWIPLILTTIPLLTSGQLRMVYSVQIEADMGFINQVRQLQKPMANISFKPVKTN